jgi:hypothetical protein
MHLQRGATRFGLLGPAAGGTHSMHCIHTSITIHQPIQSAEIQLTEHKRAVLLTYTLSRLPVY